MSLLRDEDCPACNGRRYFTEWEECNTCHGTGRVEGPANTEMTCWRCKGKGEIQVEVKCASCGGLGKKMT
jgi:DnaJ-class molecular chaperone